MLSPRFQDGKRLPTELILMILERLPDELDLKHVCEVTRFLNTVATPLLYRSLHITTNSFLSSRVYNKEHQSTSLLLKQPVRHVESLEIVHAPSMKEYMFGCEHMRRYPMRYEELLVPYLSFSQSWKAKLQFKAQCEAVLSVLKNLEPGKLRKFNWKLGHCTLPEVLSKFGILPSTQPNLESLSLLTSPKCLKLNAPYLAGFRKLKSLSWIGISTEEEFNALKGSLRCVSDRIEKLEIATTNPIRSPNFFRRIICNLYDDGFRLSRLTSLSLTNIDFREISSALVGMLDTKVLCSLSLNRCLHWDWFIRTLVEADQVSIKTFELGCVTRLVNGFDFSLFKRFPDLEDLYVDHINNEPAVELLRQLPHGGSKLRSLVIPICCTTGISVGIYGSCAAFYEGQIEDIRCNRGILDELNLECLAFAEETLTGHSLLPSHTKMFAPFQGKDCLKLIHLRTVRHLRDEVKEAVKELQGVRLRRLHRITKKEHWIQSDVHDFISRAFSPSGLDSLQIIAYGNYDDLNHIGDKVLFVRNGSPGNGFRRVPAAGYEFNQIVAKYAGFLSALPPKPHHGHEKLVLMNV